MPREIADSDDELDLTPQRPVMAIKHLGNALSPLSIHERDPLADTEFDEFLSPTQRLSSFDGNRDAGYDVAASDLLDSSTDRFLKEVAPAPSSFEPADIRPAVGSDESSMGGKKNKSQQVEEKAGKKRSRTQVEQDDNTSLFGSMSSGSNKRGKTYASGRSTLSSGEAANFRTLIAGSNSRDNNAQMENGTIDVTDSIDPAALVSIDPRSEYTSPLDLSLSISALNGANEDMPEDGTNTSHGQTPGYSLLHSYTPHTSLFGTTLQGGTTSRSSMGGYQSFNINPTELGMGYGEINPFGRLSQVTDLDEADSEETRAIANIFKNSGVNAGGNATVADASVEPELRIDSVQEMQTSPIKSAEGANVPEVFNVEEGLPNESPTFSQITDQEETGDAEKKQSVEAKGVASIRTMAVLEEPEVEIVKALPKKRGRKPKQKKSEEAEAAEHNDIDELHLEEIHMARAMRAGTVDSISNASESSLGTTSSTTLNRRKSKKAAIQPPEVLTKKLPSSDLGLNDKNIIGLSPERYVPRPSKRRGRAEPEPEPVVEVEKEQHKFSQSKTPASRDEQPAADDTPTKATLVKGKKGRRSKVKRAKTSAAALLQTSNEFLDEDEKEEAKEVVFMDERPAKVKFQPMPELSPNRNPRKEVAGEEQAATAAENVKKEQYPNDGEEDEDIVASTRRANITIDVPPLHKSDNHQELSPPVPEPKKRGRKRKKVAEDPVEGVQEQADARPALAEKDSNAQPKTGTGTNSTSKFVEKIEGDEENIETAKESSLAGKETTPIKSTTPVPTSAKPTHSPLKPTSTTPLLNARTRIGLSKRHSIPSLLRRVDRNKEPPKAIEQKEKLTKAQLEAREQERIAREEAEAEGREYLPPDLMRGKDGMLVEWDF